MPVSGASAGYVAVANGDVDGAVEHWVGASVALHQKYVTDEQTVKATPTGYIGRTWPRSPHT